MNDLDIISFPAVTVLIITYLYKNGKLTYFKEQLSGSMHRFTDDLFLHWIKKLGIHHVTSLSYYNITIYGNGFYNFLVTKEYE